MGIYETTTGMKYRYETITDCYRSFSRGSELDMGKDGLRLAKGGGGEREFPQWSTRSHPSMFLLSLSSPLHKTERLLLIQGVS